YGDFAGRIYEHPRVTVHVAEARGFVSRSRERYDLIHVSLLDSFAASGSGVQSPAAAYLYRVEALREYLRRLPPGGFWWFSGGPAERPRGSRHPVAPAGQAMSPAGVADPAGSVALIRSWNTATLLVGAGAFGPEDTEAIRAFAAARSFATAWYPGMPASAANR